MQKHSHLLPAVLDMARRGMRPCEIAEVTGMSPNAVSCRLSYWRKRGVKVAPARHGPQPARRKICATGVPEDLRDLLKVHADLRGVTVGVLARDLLDRAARDNLIDAILDDKETNP
ncbi:hypothetical protein ACLGGT_13825 [Roseovarius sp. MS2]|uniref:hypothetical protein n=1 Tax=Roseovarius sp. MS2 TaxID=3390728 RepID=UPI003EDB6E3F